MLYKVYVIYSIGFKIMVVLSSFFNFSFYCAFWLSQLWLHEPWSLMFVFMEKFSNFVHELQEITSEDACNRILLLHMKMSSSFFDPSKAVEGFQKLHQMKDNNIFKILLALADEYASPSAIRSIRVRNVVFNFHLLLYVMHPSLPLKFSFVI